MPEHFPIAAFLAAEIDSSRWRRQVESALRSRSRTRVLVDDPNCEDAAENVDRKAILAAYRGYPDKFLFKGFPNDAEWFRVKLQPVDFQSMRYANVSTLQQLSQGTLLVADGARNACHRSCLPLGAEHIPEVLAELRRGRTFLPLLLVQGLDVPLTLLEGNSRATAYFMDAKTADVDAFVARSPAMRGWAFA